MDGEMKHGEGSFNMGSPTWLSCWDAFPACPYLRNIIAGTASRVHSFELRDCHHEKRSFGYHRIQTNHFPVT